MGKKYAHASIPLPETLSGTCTLLSTGETAGHKEEHFKNWNYHLVEWAASIRIEIPVPGGYKKRRIINDSYAGERIQPWGTGVQSR